MLDAHPAIGARDLSARSAAEQGADDDPAVLAELAELNRAYEERFGFRFVVFVNRRPKREIVPILRERLERTRERGARDGARRARRDRDDRWRRVLGDRRLLVGLGRPALPLAARDRGDRVDRRVVLLHRARQPPRAAATSRDDASAASAARSGRSTAAASTASRSSASRRTRLPEPLTGSSGRRTRRGSRASRCFVVVYYVARVDLPRRPDRSPTSTAWEAIAISVGGLVLAWLVYDGLCRAVRATTSGALAVLVFAFVCAVARGRRASSSRRAPRTSQVGAMLGTIMVGNVFFVIIPAHWELVRAKEAGREPDPRWNARGKQRSVHNNYLTLPVVFAMLSNHFPFTYGHEHALARPRRADGARRARSRHYFNLRHRGRNVWWILGRGRRGRRSPSRC